MFCTHIYKKTSINFCITVCYLYSLRRYIYQNWNDTEISMHKDDTQIREAFHILGVVVVVE